MPIRLGHIAKETGAALAVLALYMLVLLAPLHQAAGLQRDMALLGYESSLSWSVCTSVVDADAGDETPTAAKCPLASVGKLDLTMPAPPAHLPAPAARAAAMGHDAALVFPLPAPTGLPGRPRGPPAAA